MLTGRIHSVETFGAVDGPGIRYVLFMQGCPMRCLYCHNPDSWDVKGGNAVTSESVVKDIKEYLGYIEGVTLSGGEPLLQAEFCTEVTRKCHKLGLNVAVDTAGSLPLARTAELLRECDLVLLDVKTADSELSVELTGRTLELPLATLAFLEENCKPVWIRHVLVPELTLTTERLEQLAALLAGYKCIEHVDLLPFHKMGEFKWKNLGIDYKLYATEPPSEAQINSAVKILREKGLNVVAK